MAFSRSAVEELSSLHREPDWLRARRLTSFGIYEGLAVPDTKRQEDWRQVDLKGLDLEGYAPFQQPNGTAPLGTIEDPLVSQFWSAGSGAAVLPHSLVIGGRGSRFHYVDEFLSADRQEAVLASGSAEVFLEEGANAGYVALQHWSTKTWQFANQRFQLGRDSHLNALAIALGGQMARLRVEAILEGPGSTANLKGLFFGTGDQAFDFR